MRGVPAHPAPKQHTTIASHRDRRAPRPRYRHRSRLPQRVAPPVCTAAGPFPDIGRPAKLALRRAGRAAARDRLSRLVPLFDGPTRSGHAWPPITTTQRRPRRRSSARRKPRRARHRRRPRRAHRRVPALEGRLARAHVLESDSVVGGISRTVERDGWRFDIGGHRFFTKVKPVDDLWFEILGADEFLRRPRHEPHLLPGQALSTTRSSRSTCCATSGSSRRCGAWRRTPGCACTRRRTRPTLEGYVASHYGWRLYRHFFKTYNEKVWGVPGVGALGRLRRAAHQEHVDRGRGVGAAPRPACSVSRDKSQAGHEPHRGVQLPEVRPGPDVGGRGREGHGRGRRSSSSVTRSCASCTATAPRTRSSRATRTPATSTTFDVHARHLVDADGRAAARDGSAGARRRARPRPTASRYRDFMTVALVVPLEFSFPDTWIYIHDPDVEVGRVQNFGSWSPYMVKDGRTCLGLEFWVHEGDDDVVEVRRRARRAGQARAAPPRSRRSREGRSRLRRAGAEGVSRVRRHLPGATSSMLRRWLAAKTPNVFPTGRNGMHRYNNQDHSMLTAMLSVENILAARTTTSGRSTSTPSTTRSTRTRRRTARPAATRRCCRAPRSTPRPRRGRRGTRDPRGLDPPVG